MFEQDEEKLCDGRMVRYCHVGFGTFFLPLQDMANTSDAYCSDRRKNPVWLAELHVNWLYDAYTQHCQGFSHVPLPSEFQVWLLSKVMLGRTTANFDYGYLVEDILDEFYTPDIGNDDRHEAFLAQNRICLHNEHSSHPNAGEASESDSG